MFGSLALTGCGSKSSDQAEAPTSQYIALDDSEVVLPAGLVGTEVDDENIVSVDKTNGDVTYSLSGSERTEIVSNLVSEINASIDTILADDDHYPDIESITPNSDYTEFTIALTNGQANMYESMLSMSFYTIGNKYQIYTGVDNADALTTVTYTNAATGEVVAQSDSSSMTSN
jgi:hypothetical protein